ncbi:MAG: phosphatidate cytidylyltransferase [Actinobacteria bacterium]|nr:phosphatidate cytidylyltransferase [Actinomycetota bacterium]
MSDWRDDEYDDEPRRGREPTGEGVRILGSEAGSPSPPSFAAGDDEYDTWSASDEGWSAQPATGETSGSMSLPHWTEPPTGEVPRILDDDTSDDLESWSSLTGGSTPRFRSDAGDWAAGDFEEGELSHDDSTLIGALDESPSENPYGEPTLSRKARRELREAEAKGKGRGGRKSRPADLPPADYDSMDIDSMDTDYSDDSMQLPTVAAASGSLEGPPRAPVPGRRPDPRDGGPGGAPGGPETQQRVITGVIAAVVAIVCFALGTVTTLILATVIVGIAAMEFYEALRRAGYHTATLVGLIGCVAIVPIAYDQGKDAFPMMIFLVTAFTMLWYLFEVMKARPVVNIALTLMVFAYIGCFGAFAGLFLAAPDGVGYILGVVLCVIAYDIVGWFVGSSMGRTPLMPRISPNKTMEGLLGGMAAAFVMAIFVTNVISGWDQGSLFDGVLLGIVIAVTAPLGDLVESMIKRDLGVKDLGTLLPGHGGLSDRFDALLFTLPAAYYVAIHIVT